MTINEVIEYVDTVKPGNGVDRPMKIKWLSTLDQRIKKEIIDLHEDDGCDTVFNGYGESTPGDTVLLVPAPYEPLYIHWLEAQMAYINGEFNQFNNAITMYNAEYASFASAYRREHKPLTPNLKFF